jgi:signal transduction histidine kinase
MTLEALLDEQAALRRLAGLVAESPDSAAIFAAVCAEAGRLLGVRSTNLSRYTADGIDVTLGGWSQGGQHLPVGTRLPLAPDVVGYWIRRTSAPVRLDADEQVTSELGLLFRASGIRSSVAAPIVFDGRVWGALVASSVDETPLPAGTESRLASFSELIGPAIANAEAQAQLERLVEEQAALRQVVSVASEESRNSLRELLDEQEALRRIAVLVAREPSQDEVFSAVTGAVKSLIGADLAAMFVFGDGTATLVASSGSELPMGTKLRLDSDGAAARIFRTAAAVRIDDYVVTEGETGELARELRLRSSVGAPVLIEGKLWGALVASTRNEVPLPAIAEKRLAAFTELVATAVSNAQARDAIRRLADEQAALRRVATLVARGEGPAEIFSAVSREVHSLFGLEGGDLDVTTVVRFDPGPEFELVSSVKAVEGLPIGSRWAPNDIYVTTRVQRTGSSARVDEEELARAESPEAEELRAYGVTSQVASPIVVDGRLWGAMNINATRALPVDTEERLEKFTELVATAIANAESRSQLAASRKRLVAASDEARRKIERNLHDGTQQRLLALGLDVGTVRAKASEARPETQLALARIEREIEAILDEIRELSRGLHPGLLARQGLGPALRVLARRCSLPVTVDVALVERAPAAVETCVYYVVSEALTNAVRHSKASEIEVSVRATDGVIVAVVTDDGVGGAEAGSGAGSGLVGLTDRVEALDGRLSLESSSGQGTTLSIELPLGEPLSL